MGDILGHRRVFGVLVPYFNTVVEPELADLRPLGVTNQTTRFTLDANVLQDVAECTRKLAACGLDAMLVALSPEFLPGGIELMQQAASDAARELGRPVLTTPLATHAALRELGASRIGLVTPFDDAANEHVRSAFEANGFAVAAIRGIPAPSFEAIAKTDPGEIRRACREAALPEVEAIAQVGTGLPLLHLVHELEQELARPVVSCNAALYWHALRETGIRDARSGFGSLLSSH
jgi:maleate isomerase